jgi:hypothetical protein
MGSNFCCSCSDSAIDYKPLSSKSAQNSSYISTDTSEQEIGLQSRFGKRRKTVSFLEGEVPNVPLKRLESILRRRPQSTIKD